MRDLPPLLTFGWLAGLVGALTGLGGGVVLVPLLTLLFHVDLHYALDARLFSVVVTSSGAAFMIWVTAVAGAGVYWKAGYIQPLLVFPVMLGVLVGALLGSRVVVQSPVASLRLVFVVVLALLGLKMVSKGVLGW